MIDSASKGTDLIWRKQVTLMDSFRSVTHAVFALRVHFGEVQVANWSEGICRVDHHLRCIAARTQTHTNVKNFYIQYL